jgi:hypothetical protein
MCVQIAQVTFWLAVKAEVVCLAFAICPAKPYERPAVFSTMQPVAAGINEQQVSVKPLLLGWNACRVQIVMLRGG